MNQKAVQEFFVSEQPTQVYLAAAKVGGIHANNTYPAECIYQNLMVHANVIHAAHTHGVQKLLFLGSSGIYPKLAPQPMSEDALLTGTLEPTNEPYAIARIAGIKLCESYSRQYGRDYRSVTPTNLCGGGDNHRPENRHVILALIRRFHEAKVNGATELGIWGAVTPRREFLYVSDMAAVSLHVVHLPASGYSSHTLPIRKHINDGFGSDVSISDLSCAVAKCFEYSGRIGFYLMKPDGVPRKWLDSSRISGLGWRPKVALSLRLELAYSDMQHQIGN